MAMNGRVILETTEGKLDGVQTMAEKNGVNPAPADALKHSLRRYLFTSVKLHFRLVKLIFKQQRCENTSGQITSATPAYY